MRNPIPEITRALIARVGVDLAKNVFQVHAVDAGGRRVVRRSLKRDQLLASCQRGPPPGCLLAMEACSGAHAWARRLRAFGGECPDDRRDLRTICRRPGLQSLP